jgi:hypothetical protein
LIAAELRLNSERVPSSEDNSVFKMTLIHKVRVSLPTCPRSLHVI